jgi:hypothetical protein
MDDPKAFTVDYDCRTGKQLKGAGKKQMRKQKKGIVNHATKQESKIGRISGGKRRRKHSHLAAANRSAAVETPGRAIRSRSRAPAREVKKENPILCSPSDLTEEPKARTISFQRLTIR